MHSRSFTDCKHGTDLAAVMQNILLVVLLLLLDVMTDIALLALSRRKFEDSKLAHKELTSRLAGIATSPATDVETDSLTSVPLTETSLIKVRQFWQNAEL